MSTEQAALDLGRLIERIAAKAVSGVCPAGQVEFEIEELLKSQLAALQARETQLVGELDAANQHVKVLQANHADDHAKWESAVESLRQEKAQLNEELQAQITESQRLLKDRDAFWLRVEEQEQTVLALQAENERRMAAVHAAVQRAWAHLDPEAHPVMSADLFQWIEDCENAFCKERTTLEQTVGELTEALREVVEHARPAFPRSPFREALDKARVALAAVDQASKPEGP